MSNVLIGIIGVILFIGLALAGALILGDDFRTASSSSKASSIIAQMQQVSAAINMYELKTGQIFYVQDLTVLIPRFLKSTPVSPMPLARVDSTLVPKTQPNDTMITRATAPAASSRILSTYVTTHLGYGNDPVAESTCQAIADTYSGGVLTVSSNTPPGTAGCMQYGGAGGAFIAWMRR